MKDLRRLMKRPENVFLALGGFFGFLFVFLVPPMQVPDEQSHFYQSYAVSNFKIVPEKFIDSDGKVNFGVEIPRSVSTAAETLKESVAGKPDVAFEKHLFKQFIDQPLEPQNVHYHASTSLYSPVVYIPQAIGITVGKVFNSSPLVMIWFARLTNLATWLLLIYFAIKLLPFAKWAVVVLALNPMAVFLSASLSADVMTTGLAFLLFSVVAVWYVKSETITYKWMATIIGLIGLLALTKPVNVLFSLLLFAIPWRRFKSVWKYLTFCIVGVVLAVVVGLSWSLTTGEANQVITQIAKPDAGVVPAEQIAGILQRPFEYIKILTVNYIVVPAGYPGDSVLRSFFGTFGWFDVSIPIWAIILYVCGLMLALGFQAGRDLAITIRQKLVLLAIFTLLIVGNITAMYAFFTPVGAHIIGGVQGRYFIPASILLVALFTARRRLLALKEELFIAVLALVTGIVLTSSVVTIIARYYT